MASKAHGPARRILFLDMPQWVYQFIAPTGFPDINNPFHFGILHFEIEIDKISGDISKLRCQKFIDIDVYLDDVYLKELYYRGQSQIHSWRVLFTFTEYFSYSS